ncbi:MAG TPA: efflux RND transporter periplasmic adaptor subunit [Verrucomicrobiae bacterium]|jgi:RND family efflux transporter MFP subunit|nr:efflux RND transporter periplasmic adaptor subunit [Verrucomicrobiae bacterium]
MSKRTRNILIVVVALVVVIVIAVLSGRRGKDAVSVRTVKVAYTTFQTKLPESGVIQHPGTATIPTLVGGNVGQIYVRAGQYVAAGQLLATVDAPTLQSDAAGSEADYSSAVANIASARSNEQNAKVQYQASVDTAKSALDEAQRVYEADVNLYNNKAIAKQQVDADKAKRDQAQVQYDQAEAQLRLGAVSGYGQNSVQSAQAMAQKAQIVNSQNQQQLGFTQIVAPFAGAIQTIATNPSDALRNVQGGDPVLAGQALFTIAEGNGFIVKAQVDEQDIINVRVGQRANITGEDFPGRKLGGHVSDISPVAVKSADATSTAKQVLTTIQLDRSPSFLKDGMTVDIDILTVNIPHVVALPNAAIGKQGGKAYVYVVTHGKAFKRTVVTGLIGDTQTIVKSGIGRGDVVIAAIDPTLHDGIAVLPMASGTSSPAP